MTIQTTTMADVCVRHPTILVGLSFLFPFDTGQICIRFDVDKLEKLQKNAHFVDFYKTKIWLKTAVFIKK